MLRNLLCYANLVRRKFNVQSCKVYWLKNKAFYITNYNEYC